MTEPLNLFEYAEAARALLPEGIHDYYAGGAADDITLGENESDWSRLRIRPRVMAEDVGACDLKTTILGREVGMPLMMAPCGLNNMAHPDGELGVARAAAAAGLIQVVSMGSGFSLEEIAAVNRAPRWFQLYVIPDRGVTRSLVERAEAAGYGAICLTVDAPVDGIREHNVRNRFRAPAPGFAWTNMAPYPDPKGRAWQWEWHDPTITWETVDWLRGITRLPVVLKGILAPEDARLAADHGAAGIIVSNHGGRQLDTSLTSCAALPAIAEAAAGRVEIYADGGIRRGSDMLKALALGARAVLIGRPYLWALAVGGEAGVRRMLDILREEFRVNLALSGCARVGEVHSSLIGRR